MSQRATDSPKHSAPLSERMRPQSLDDFIGQAHLVAPGSILHHMIASDNLYSIILWGPPGTGKTTIAHILAKHSHSAFAALSAVTSGLKEVREVIKKAQQTKEMSGNLTILFIDEIHRFNKAQQDAFLPHVEHGDIILVGATTENPSFEVVGPLLSRTKVLLLKPLNPAEINTVLQRALQDRVRGLAGMNPQVTTDAIDMITASAQGDARVALNTLEMAVSMSPVDENGRRVVESSTAEIAIQKKVLCYDKSGEEHYNLISALHKSLRSSDPDASIYWLARMLESGEDPLYVARRMIRFASEDIGNADPRALQVALNAKDAYHFLGTPEGNLALVQAVVYLATAPKSNAVYRAYSRAEKNISETGSLSVPMHLRNAPTELMRRHGYGEGYIYDHDSSEGISGQECLPEIIRHSRFYEPTERGFEKTITERMVYLRKKRRK